MARPVGDDRAVHLVLQLQYLDVPGRLDHHQCAAILRDWDVFAVAELGDLEPDPFGVAGAASLHGVDDDAAFAVALEGPTAYASAYPNCDWLLADANLDGDVTEDDQYFFDRLKQCWNCHANIDGDDQVGLADLTILLSNYSESGSYTDGDLDCTGVIDLSDLTAMLSSYGHVCFEP